MKTSTALIGFTGFVGSNLQMQYPFEHYYNSKNISQIEGKTFDLVICAGVSAVKWLANQEPIVDLENIQKLQQHLSTIKTQCFVLISTIDIYDQPLQKDEDSLPDTSRQDFYGKHRYQLEQWVSENFENHHILRLPGLFGENLKKNLIFDLLHPLPLSINKNLWAELQKKLTLSDLESIKNNYAIDQLGNLQIQKTSQAQEQLMAIFSKISFSTLNFTDSRSVFQFYDLKNLWKDIQFAIQNKIPILNISAEPLSARALVEAVLGKNFDNLTEKGPVLYDMYSKYASDKKYLYSQKETLSQIKYFIIQHQK